MRLRSICLRSEGKPAIRAENFLNFLVRRCCLLCHTFTAPGAAAAAPAAFNMEQELEDEALCCSRLAQLSVRAQSGEQGYFNGDGNGNGNGILDEERCRSSSCLATTEAKENGYFPAGYLPEEERVIRAWKHWRDLGEPKFIVAPMVDQSELPFRMLCRKYGATAAYTPMLHSRLFFENLKYRSLEFTTCTNDRPLFVQFCANDPERLLAAAQIVQPYCDYVDINLGCPQRIAKRGNYGAFLMDNLPLVKALVEKLANNLIVPVSCKIRIFPNIEDTIAYAKMLEAAGCSLLAVHGRTKDQKDGKSIRADWNAISLVKKALKIPVLANGNIRHLEDAYNCLKETNVDGVLSAESLLENPALFAGYHVMVTEPNNESFDGFDWLQKFEAIKPPSDGEINGMNPASLLLEYFDLCEKYPVPWRIVRAHVHRMLGNWFKIYPDLREELNKQTKLSFHWLRDLVTKLSDRDVKFVLHPSTSSS